MSSAKEVIGEVGRAMPIVLQGENAKIGRLDLELVAGQEGGQGIGNLLAER